MNFESFKNKMLQSPAFREEYYNTTDLAFEISEMIIEARIKKGLSQKQLAKLARTKQPSIARIENCTSLPSLSFLEKIAKALDTHLIPPKFASFTGSDQSNYFESSEVSEEQFDNINFGIMVNHKKHNQSPETILGTVQLQLETDQPVYVNNL